MNWFFVTVLGVLLGTVTSEPCDPTKSDCSQVNTGLSASNEFLPSSIAVLGNADSPAGMLVPIAPGSDAPQQAPQQSPLLPLLQSPMLPQGPSSLDSSLGMGLGLGGPDPIFDSELLGLVNMVIQESGIAKTNSATLDPTMTNLTTPVTAAPAAQILFDPAYPDLIMSQEKMNHDDAERFCEPYGGLFIPSVTKDAPQAPAGIHLWLAGKRPNNGTRHQFFLDDGTTLVGVKNYLENNPDELTADEDCLGVWQGTNLGNDYPCNFVSDGSGEARALCSSRGQEGQNGIPLNDTGLVYSPRAMVHDEAVAYCLTHYKGIWRPSLEETVPTAPPSINLWVMGRRPVDSNLTTFHNELGLSVQFAQYYPENPNNFNNSEHCLGIAAGTNLGADFNCGQKDDPFGEMRALCYTEARQDDLTPVALNDPDCPDLGYSPTKMTHDQAIVYCDRFFGIYNPSPNKITPKAPKKVNLWTAGRRPLTNATGEFLNVAGEKVGFASYVAGSPSSSSSQENCLSVESGTALGNDLHCASTENNEGEMRALCYLVAKTAEVPAANTSNATVDAVPETPSVNVNKIGSGIPLDQDGFPGFVYSPSSLSQAEAIEYCKAYGGLYRPEANKTPPNALSNVDFWTQGRRPAGGAADEFQASDGTFVEFPTYIPGHPSNLTAGQDCLGIYRGTNLGFDLQCVDVTQDIRALCYPDPETMTSILSKAPAMDAPVTKTRSNVSPADQAPPPLSPSSNDVPTPESPPSSSPPSSNSSIAESAQESSSTSSTTSSTSSTAESAQESSSTSSTTSSTARPTTPIPLNDAAFPGYLYSPSSMTYDEAITYCKDYGILYKPSKGTTPPTAPANIHFWVKGRRPENGSLELFKAPDGSEVEFGSYIPENPDNFQKQEDCLGIHAGTNLGNDFHCTPPENMDMRALCAPFPAAIPLNDRSNPGLVYSPITLAYGEALNYCQSYGGIYKPESPIPKAPDGFSLWVAGLRPEGAALTTFEAPDRSSVSFETYIPSNPDNAKNREHCLGIYKGTDLGNDFSCQPVGFDIRALCYPAPSTAGDAILLAGTELVYSPVSMDHEDAITYCQDYGGLYRPWMNTPRPTAPDNISFWSQGRRPKGGAIDAFVNSAGESIAYQSYLEGNPDNFQNIEDCLGIFQGTNMGNDFPCTGSNRDIRALCYKARPAIPLNDPAFPGLVYSASSMSYTQARAYCKKLGKLWTPSPNGPAPTAPGGIHLWVDGHRKGNDFFASDGTQVGFQDWLPGNPDNYNGVEACLGIFEGRNQGNDYPCNPKAWDLRALCQKIDNSKMTSSQEQQPATPAAPAIPLNDPEHPGLVYSASPMSQPDSVSYCRLYGGIWMPSQKTSVPKAPSGVHLWTAGHRPSGGSVSTFAASNGVQVAFSEYLPGNPDNENNKEHCLGIFEGRNQGNDYSCDVLQSGINIRALCYGSKPPTVKTQSSTGSPLEYSIEKMNYADAVKFCRRFGFLFEPTQGEALPTAPNNIHFWIAGKRSGAGLYDFTNMGKAVQPFSWNPGNPDNYANREHCLGILKGTNEANDFPCDVTDIADGELRALCVPAW